jgi:hypothetical protein
VLGIPLAGGRRRWFALTQAFVDRFPAVEVEMREARGTLTTPSG